MGSGDDAAIETVRTSRRHKDFGVGRKEFHQEPWPAHEHERPTDRRRSRRAAPAKLAQRNSDPDGHDAEFEKGPQSDGDLKRACVGLSWHGVFTPWRRSSPALAALRAPAVRSGLSEQQGSFCWMPGRPVEVARWAPCSGSHPIKRPPEPPLAGRSPNLSAVHSKLMQLSEQAAYGGAQTVERLPEEGPAGVGVHASLHAPDRTYRHNDIECHGA